MNRYYITFGYGHVPSIGYYTTIDAKDEEDAREIMHKVTNKWAFMYDSEEDAGVEHWDLIHISLKDVENLVKADLQKIKK